MSETFSDRHGYRGPELEITVREDAPEKLRYAIPLMAQHAEQRDSDVRLYCLRN